MKRSPKKPRARRKLSHEVPRRRWPGWMLYPVRTIYDLPPHAVEVLGPKLAEALIGMTLGDFILCSSPKGAVKVFWCCRVCGSWREQPGSLCPSCSLYEVFDTSDLRPGAFNFL